MRRRNAILGGFVGTYLLAFSAVAIARWNYEFVFYGIVLLLEVAGVVWLDRRVRFSTGVLVALALWGLLHMMGGTIPIPESVTEPTRPPVLYNLRLHPWTPKYDQLVHALGFGAATWAAAEALRHLLIPGRRSLGLFLALVFIGSGLGAFNEVIEFAATLIMPGTNVGGYDNTGWDLVSNLAGAAGASFLWCWRGESWMRAGEPDRPVTPMPTPCTTSGP